jgi:hypothetical protein
MSTRRRSCAHAVLAHAMDKVSAISGLIMITPLFWPGGISSAQATLSTMKDD